MTYPQSWDQVEMELQDLLKACSGCLMLENALAASLQNLEMLRQEFEFDVLRPHRSLGTLVLKPFPEKPFIYIYCEKSGALCRVYRYSGETIAEETKVFQEQLVSTVYDYLERLKAL